MRAESLRGIARLHDLINVTGDVNNVTVAGGSCVADDTVVVTPSQGQALAVPPVEGAILDIPGTISDYVNTSPISGYSGGDFDIVALIGPKAWANGATQTIFSSSDGGATQKSVSFYVNTTGHLGVVLSTDGVTGTTYDTSVAVPGKVDGQLLWVRVTFDVDNGASSGTLAFYTSSNGTTWGSPYQSLTVTGTTALHVSTKNISVGIRNSGDLPYTGRIGFVQFKSGIGGTVRASFAPNDASWNGTDTVGNVWSLNGTSSRWSIIESTVDGLVSDLNSIKLSIVSAVPPIFGYQATDLLLPMSSFVLQDTSLSVSVVANTIYAVEGYLQYDSSQTADLKISFVGPSGATMTWTPTGLKASAVSATDSSTWTQITTIGGNGAFGGNGVGTVMGGRFSGFLAVGSTAGIFKMQAAQNFADATQSTLRAGSWMRLQKIA